MRIIILGMYDTACTGKHVIGGWISLESARNCIAQYVDEAIDDGFTALWIHCENLSIVGETVVAVTCLSPDDTVSGETLKVCVEWGAK